MMMLLQPRGDDTDTDAGSNGDKEEKEEEGNKDKEGEGTTDGEGRKASSRKKTCADCNKQYCLSQHLHICEGKAADEVFTTCFQRDSRKDEAVVFIFIFATASLLGWAALKPWFDVSFPSFPLFPSSTLLSCPLPSLLSA
ncbi:MAG: hypothetical protein LQ346_009094 [Caloplaca aetnensis]|nr:MAG: hypothetical protein LQ346_009094 [Caloplaca aetnensis]